MRLLNAIVAISVMTGWAAAIPVDIAPSASGATSPNIPLVPLVGTQQFLLAHRPRVVQPLDLIQAKGPAQALVANLR